MVVISYLFLCVRSVPVFLGFQLVSGFDRSYRVSGRAYHTDLFGGNFHLFQVSRVNISDNPKFLVPPVSAPNFYSSS